MADTVSSDKGASLEDELLEHAKTPPERTASDGVPAIPNTSVMIAEKIEGVQTDSAVEERDHHVPTWAENLKSSPLEDLDSFNLIEPPPLDWRSDSSSECSLRDIDEPGSFHTDSMEAPTEELRDCGGQIMNFTPETPSEIEDLTNQEVEMNQPNTGEILQKSIQDKREEKPEEHQSRKQDMDHSHIQTLLTQLQLFHPTSSKDATKELETEQSTSTPESLTDRHSSACLVPEVSPYQTCPEGSIASGLLFTESHQRDLLALLEEPESKEPDLSYTAQTSDSHIGHLSQLIDHQTRYTAQSGEADEMVCVSYNQDIWHNPLEDEFMVSGYSEDEVSERWLQVKSLSSDDMPSHSADVVGDCSCLCKYNKPL